MQLKISFDNLCKIYIQHMQKDSSPYNTYSTMRTIFEYQDMQLMGSYYLFCSSRLGISEVMFLDNHDFIRQKDGLFNLNWDLISYSDSINEMNTVKVNDVQIYDFLCRKIFQVEPGSEEEQEIAHVISNKSLEFI